jgi:hypothetical protein
MGPKWPAQNPEGACSAPRPFPHLPHMLEVKKQTVQVLRLAQAAVLMDFALKKYCNSNSSMGIKLRESQGTHFRFLLFSVLMIPKSIEVWFFCLFVFCFCHCCAPCAENFLPFWAICPDTSLSGRSQTEVSFSNPLAATKSHFLRQP